MVNLLERYDDVLTISDICEILHIGKNTAYRLLQEGEIPNRKIKHKYIIPKNGIIEYLKLISNPNY